MSSEFPALKAALSADAPGLPPRWEEVLGDLARAMYSSPTPEAEQVMLEALRFEGELRLRPDEASEVPHGMTPEELVKSLAVQTLGEWTGGRYLPTFRRLAATASASLVSVIEAVIEKAAAGGG